MSLHSRNYNNLVIGFLGGKIYIGLEGGESNLWKNHLEI